MARRSVGAIAIAAGIFLSRIFGLVRERVLAHYLGNSAAAGAFKAALRIPNLLQNLLGEGVLSASFIPVYARLLAEGRADEAAKVASVVASLLALATALLSALGVLGARSLIELIAPGFHGEVRELTIQLVQIMFPGVGLLVLSAWCLGVLNSHKRFFLSYVAPVLWNIAQIAALLAFGAYAAEGFTGQFRLARALAWATVAGAGLQLSVQLPQTLALVGRLRPALALDEPGTRRVLTNFGPALLGRGVVQVSAYIDQILASFLGPSAVAGMAYAQQLYLLPGSLFGMAISAAELATMSRAIGPAEAVGEALKTRLTSALERIAFFVIPSVVAFVLLGDVVVALLYQTGSFSASDTRFVWWVLAGSSAGLLATTQARLVSSALYALHDTRTPLYCAIVRVVLTGALGWAIALPIRVHFGWPAPYGAAGLTASAGVAGWVEFVLLRRGLAQRIGPVPSGARAQLLGWMAALIAGASALAIRRALPIQQPVTVGAVVLGTYGGLYLVFAVLLGLPNARSLVRRLPL